MTDTKNQLVASRVKKIIDLQTEIERDLNSFARNVVICGAELLRLCAENKGQFEAIFEKQIARPKLGLTMAYKYMAVAEKVASKLGPNGVKLLTAGKLEAGQAATEGFYAETWEQLLLGLGMVKAGKARGGYAALLAWLQKHHPECKAKKLADLPAEIREEWEKELAIVKAEKGHTERAAGQRIFANAVTACHSLAERGLHRHMSREQTEHAIKLLNDVRSILLKELK